MRPTSWRGHDFITALVAVSQEANPGLRVLDGPPPNKISDQEVLLVGWAPFIERHAVSRREDDDLTGRAVEEGEVACYVALRQGDRGVSGMRERAAEIVTNIEVLIRKSRVHFDDACDEVAVGPTMTLTQSAPKNEGATVGFAFAVSYRAWV